MGVPTSHGGLRIQCQWFLMCENEAIGTMPHPILGDVPICDRCRSHVEAIESDVRNPDGPSEKLV